MKIFKALTIFVLAGFILCSCEYEWIQPIKVPIPDNVSFSANIQPIFNNGCNTSICHGAGGKAPDLSEANAYTALMNGGYVDIDTPESSILYVTMTSGSMKNYVKDPSDPDIILAWIEQGAENN